MENVTKNLDWKTALIGFLLPVVGFILYLTWKDEKPIEAISAMKGAVVSLVTGLVVYGVFFITTAWLGASLFF